METPSKSNILQEFCPNFKHCRCLWANWSLSWNIIFTPDFFVLQGMHYSGIRGWSRERVDRKIEFGDFFLGFSTFDKLCVAVSLWNHQKWIPREIPRRYRSGEVEKAFFSTKIDEKSWKIAKIDCRTPGGAGNLLWEFPLIFFLEIFEKSCTKKNFFFRTWNKNSKIWPIIFFYTF